jgi:uncharacterized protein (DUF362 family)
LNKKEVVRKMTKVAVVVTDNRREGITKAIELLDINPFKGRQVVFKPNFNTADPPPASTHIDTFEQIVIELQKMGAKEITVAERSGPANTAESFKKKGVYEMAEKYGFNVVNLENPSENEYVHLQPENTHWKNGFHFAKIFLEAEAIIEACCLKTHKFGGHFTLSLKNAVGLVPRKDFDYMKELHSSEHQRKMIAEINSVYKPDIIVMDGMETFVDGGPMEGTMKEANIIVAGTDKIAIDAVGVAILRLLGTTPEVSKDSIFNQEQIARAIELNIGIKKPEEIEFITEDEVSTNKVKEIKKELQK